jgi:hypothetical protein
MNVAKARRHFGVERGVLLEPALVSLAVIGAFAEPESEHLIGTIVGHGRRC